MDTLGHQEDHSLGPRAKEPEPPLDTQMTKWKLSVWHILRRQRRRARPKRRGTGCIKHRPEPGELSQAAEDRTLWPSPGQSGLDGMKHSGTQSVLPTIPLEADSAFSPIFR